MGTPRLPPAGGEKSELVMTKLPNSQWAGAGLALTEIKRVQSCGRAATEFTAGAMWWKHSRWISPTELPPECLRDHRCWRGTRTPLDVCGTLLLKRKTIKHPLERCTRFSALFLVNIWRIGLGGGWDLLLLCVLGEKWPNTTFGVPGGAGGCTKGLLGIRSREGSGRGHCDLVLPWTLPPVFCPFPLPWGTHLTVCFKHSKTSCAKWHHTGFTAQAENLPVSPLHKHKINIKIYQIYGCTSQPLSHHLHCVNSVRHFSSVSSLEPWAAYLIASCL